MECRKKVSLQVLVYLLLKHNLYLHRLPVSNCNWSNQEVYHTAAQHYNRSCSWSSRWDDAISTCIPNGRWKGRCLMVTTIGRSHGRRGPGGSTSPIPVVEQRQSSHDAQPSTACVGAHCDKACENGEGCWLKRIIQKYVNNLTDFTQSRYNCWHQLTAGFLIYARVSMSSGSPNLLVSLEIKQLTYKKKAHWWYSIYANSNRQLPKWVRARFSVHHL